MKTLDLLAVATLLLLSIGTFANTYNDTGRFTKINKQVVALDPQDIDFEEIETLKEIGSPVLAPKASFPATATPDVEDVNKVDIENLKNIKITDAWPRMAAGVPEDLNLDDIEALKVL